MVLIAGVLNRRLASPCCNLKSWRICAAAAGNCARAINLEKFCSISPCYLWVDGNCKGSGSWTLFHFCGVFSKGKLVMMKPPTLHRSKQSATWQQDFSSDPWHSMSFQIALPTTPRLYHSFSPISKTHKKLSLTDLVLSQERTTTKTTVSFIFFNPFIAAPWRYMQFL